MHNFCIINRNSSMTVFTMFLLFFMNFTTISSANNLNIIYDFSTTNIPTSDAHILTLKFKNLVEQQGLLLTFASDLKNSVDSLPIECNNIEVAKKIRAITNSNLLFWGNIGKIDNTYICSVYKLSSLDSNDIYEVFQEEISGQLSDVLKYAIQNLAMKVTGHTESLIKKPETVVAVQPSSQVNVEQKSTQNVSKGWLKINLKNGNVKVFIDGESVGRGSQEIELPIGVHKIVAKTENETQSKLIEIFKNDISVIEFDFDSDDGDRNPRFFMSFDASWMLGDAIEFGPSHTIGIEIKKHHLIALNYYWGLAVFSEYIFGGGAQYMYTFNVRDIFLARFGGCTGFWLEYGYNQYYNSSYGWEDDYWETMYFGGPRIRLEVGYKHVYFTIVDATLLIGEAEPKAMLNSGISFRF